MGHRARVAGAVLTGMITLAATLLGTATPAAAQASTATTAATTTAQPTDQYCAVSFTVNQWPGAAIVNVTIRNISTVTVRWQVLTFPGPVPSIQFWNVNVTVSGSNVIVVPSSFTPVPPADTGVLAPGQSVTIGFIYYPTGSLVLPTAQVICTPV